MRSHVKGNTCTDSLQRASAGIGSEFIDPGPSGKPRSWKQHKVSAVRISNVFLRSGDDESHIKMTECGSWLKFRRNVRTGERTLHRAYFCKKRVCPVCAWRRSRKLAHQMLETLQHVMGKHTGIRFLHLVVSQRNCDGHQLNDQIRKMNKAWTRMTRWKRFSSSVLGYYKALEITYNSEARTYHPHFHILLAVPADYFRIDDGQYIPQWEWIELWRKAMKLDYDPTAHIQAVRMGTSNELSFERDTETVNASKAILEITKYVTKFSDILSLSDESELDDVILTLDAQTANLRFLSFGGLIRDARRELKHEDVETSDLTDSEDPDSEEDQYIEEVVEWDPVRGIYVLVEVTPVLNEKSESDDPGPGGPEP